MVPSLTKEIECLLFQYLILWNYELIRERNITIENGQTDPNPLTYSVQNSELKAWETYATFRM